MDRVWKGNPRLEPLLLPISDLDEDPANARQHPEANLRKIRGSLSRFGQQRPIVLDPSGRVARAGNGTLRMARDLGWTHVAAVPSDLAGSELIAYSIADNRSAEDATWDDDVLGPQLAALAGEDEALFLATGFSDDELAELERSMDSLGTGEGLPDIGEAELHQITITYAAGDEPAIRAFVGQEDGGPLSPRVGGQILAAIRGRHSG